MLRARFMIALPISVLLAQPPAMADEEYGRDGQHKESDSVYEGARSGKILPLVEIYKRVRGQITGEIIETKFEYLNGQPAYAIYFLDKKGRRREIYVDARTGVALKLGEDD
jgi:uncharacterized membrane protein YkoI